MVFIDYANADKINKLDTVWINGEEFKGIGYNGLLTVNTKTYVSEPTRANDGSMPNIADHETFIVPRCKINFKYMNIDDYRRLCNAILPNEFLVKYYDKDFGDFVEHRMYCEPQEMTKIYNVGTSVIGVLDYEVSLIGTLNAIKECSIRYDENGGTVAKFKAWTNTTTYTLGDRTKYGEDYYEAKYYINSFSGQPTLNSSYWRAITPQEWSKGVSYSAGSIVYTKTTNDENTTYLYYECKATSTTASLENTEYYTPITFKVFNANSTYKKGDYVSETIGTKTSYYKAIYEVNSFSGVLPTDTTYWKKLPILSEMKTKWGQSFNLADPMDLFSPPSGKTSSDEWQVYIFPDDDVTKDEVATTNKYAPHQNITVFRNMVLKAVWKNS